MGAEDNAAKTRRYYEALWNERDFGVIDDWIAPGFVGHYTGLPEAVRGPAGFRRFAEDIFAAMPDVRMTILDTVAQDDRVASRVEMRATHSGDYLGFAATNLPIVATHIAIERYGPDGLVLEEWANTDDLGMARQIKALPQAGSREERIGVAVHRLRTRLRRRRRS